MIKLNLFIIYNICEEFILKEKNLLYYIITIYNV